MRRKKKSNASKKQSKEGKKKKNLWFLNIYNGPDKKMDLWRHKKKLNQAAIMTMILNARIVEYVIWMLYTINNPTEMKYATKIWE